MGKNVDGGFSLFLYINQGYIDVKEGGNMR